MTLHNAGWNRGSLWRRWDPHIHAPGTILEDEFKGDWEGYLRAIEASEPRIHALGITDYYVLDSYKTVLAYKNAGRLQDIDLIFPNVELRYELGAPRGSAVNVHLLVRPDDDDKHIAELERLLRELEFETEGRTFRCERTDLISLGERIDQSTRGDEIAALREGVKQFKVTRGQLHDLCRKDAWAREHVLLAVPASSVDGSAAMQDSSLRVVRVDIERNAAVILSGQEKVREFWLGLGKVPLPELRREYGGPKPCIHGSDAHSVARVGKPDQDRFTWIKGDATFDSLVQATMEPANRSWIGPTPPSGPVPSETISEVRLTNAEWLRHEWISLNPGLVTIIGSRGSGKTALADILAAGAYALTELHLSEDKSFASRAKDYLTGSKAEIRWEDGQITSHGMHVVESGFPRVQYLSQNFVDKLCSSEGLGVSLLNEVKRVVFDAHSPETRFGAISFDDLSDTVTIRPKSSRQANQKLLADTIGQLVSEVLRSDDLIDLRKQRDALAQMTTTEKANRGKLMGEGSDARVKDLDAVTRAIDGVRAKVQSATRKRQATLSLQDEISTMRSRQMPMFLSDLRRQFVEAGLTEDEWEAFKLTYTGPVDEILTKRVAEAKAQVEALIGDSVAAKTPIPTDLLNVSVIPAGSRIEEQTLSLLEREQTRLQTLVGIDRQNAALFRRLSEKITKDEAELARLNREVTAAEAAPARIAALNATRGEAYAAVFESFVDEAEQLEALYDPLRSRLNSAQGALGKLTFHVKRRVDVEKWIVQGENLFDLRTSGPFQRKGALLGIVEETLLPTWQSGSSAAVANALKAFREKYDKAAKSQAKLERADKPSMRKWFGDYVAWLYTTDHIEVTYTIQYDGTDIEQLSPGTRGIVLLLLYVAIDQSDDRPLIIDQPEENLDPKSVNDDLVVHFREAKQRRQIIVVTHNANIVVNADADQVIVATCGKHQPGRLPDITYFSGGLERPEIRQAACDILEGGEQAFRERARRLRIALKAEDA